MVRVAPFFDSWCIYAIYVEFSDTWSEYWPVKVEHEVKFNRNEKNMSRWIYEFLVRN